MIPTIPRYGVRHVPGSGKAALRALYEGRGVQGPEILAFENQFASYHGVRSAVATSYGRMAFYYILKALQLPAGSEIIFPALTFWVVPEVARHCGLKPVFVDIEPHGFNIDPAKIESAITPRTRAIVPTHLYGQPCNMDAILSIARSRNLAIIEDCAHALGALYHGHRTGTFGHAAFFSFQMLKGLNTYGGGMAITDDDRLAAAMRAEAVREPWPSSYSVAKRIVFGEVLRALISPLGFRWSLYPVFYLGSFLGAQDLSRFLWEKIRPLTPLPRQYRQRFSNAQAIIGLRGLQELDAFNAKSRANAERLTRELASVPSIITPPAIPDTVSTFYQYCVRSSDPGRLSHRAIRKGIDTEIMHVDVCSDLQLFSDHASECPNARSSERTIQIPVYSSLSAERVDRIVQVIREAAHDLPPLRAQTTTRGNERDDDSMDRSVFQPASGP
jgi:perosamine synthetase